MATKKDSPSVQKHPDILAWERFIAGKDKGFVKTFTLGGANRDYYLENRLRATFEAGTDYGRKNPEPTH